MQLLDGKLVLSASDLTGFSACAHLTQLELRAARGEIERAKRDDPMLDVLSRRGLEHETTYLDGLRADLDTTVIEIEYPDSSRAALRVRAVDTKPVVAVKGLFEGNRAKVIVGLGDDIDDADFFALSVPDTHELVHLLQRALAAPLPLSQAS